MISSAMAVTNVSNIGWRNPCGMPPTRGQISRIKSALPAAQKGSRKGASGVSPQISGTSVSIGPLPMQGHITQPVLTPAARAAAKMVGRASSSV